MYTKEELKQQLRNVGLTGKETILIHSSMKAIGEVEGGADIVLDAWMEYFAEGENGTVLQDRLAEVMDIYIDMGNYTEEEKAALMEEDSYDSSFMEKMVEE